MQLGGLHHITAITGNASLNVAFYTDILGMRLVKKTVNQDDVSAYHLFYGDETGKPGFDLTFFDWPSAGPNREGAGTVATIALGVNSREALDWWVQRFDSFKISHEGIQVRNERTVLPFQDPEGQRLELVDAQGQLQSTYWKQSPIPAEMAIQGFYAVTLIERDLEPTASFLTETLGFRQGENYQSEEGNTVSVFEMGPGGAGAEVHLDVRPGTRGGRPGIGGVHHVAFRTPDDEEQEQWFQTIGKHTRNISSIIDRFYFHSIYFREPGGVLFEIATDGPGFATDEDLEHLGEQLALPPFLEPHRQEIEENLRPIVPFKLASVR
ncbi:ring-cleaving dioxygenase [Ktedonobacter racemifer]|uniref:Glyoxalase/bleomycin resistance protein/dioxygenase n=1 Tax=Ktedonobacter racemifer DSM 44963 TaxID=485913 RepID=D6U2G4_KTERA|nr:ring-cleaving dioxygenase [Ktedonobacter racemifer]EFH82832.1 Glyoxalase/bleomycin resistance protein/dioxygenase [Ktedonobacter racemifer DSM 44963]